MMRTVDGWPCFHKIEENKLDRYDCTFSVLILSTSFFESHKNNEES